MIPYNSKTKDKAIALRKKGKSFSQIAKTLGIGKSTVGFWFKNVIGKSKAKKSVKVVAKVKTKKKVVKKVSKAKTKKVAPKATRPKSKKSRA